MKPLNSCRYLVLLAFLLLPGCRGYPEKTGTQPVVRSLVETFDPEWLVSERERLVFHDPVVQKQALAEDWELDANPDETQFPWPRFTPSGGTVFLNWKQRMERRITLKLLNISKEFPRDLLVLTLNNQPLPLLDSTLPTGEYEFYVPSALQRTGMNDLHIVIRREALPPDRPLNSIGMHSIRVTLGAVVKNTIRIGDQVRNSLLFAPPVGLRIPYQADRKQHLQFSYGLYSPVQSDDEYVYSLRITLYKQASIRPVFDRTFPIIRNGQTGRQWESVKQRLPAVPEAGFLEISFSTDAQIPDSVDYLALSEVLIVPANQAWALKTESIDSDVILATLSSVSASQIGSYGNAGIRTPFLDRLSLTGSLFMDATAASNGEIPSILSLITGKLPRDHGEYRNSKQNGILPAVITEFLGETAYQSHVFAYTSAESHSLFGRLPGFKRVYLSDPAIDTMDTVNEQVNGMLVSPYMLARPGLFWFHLAPEIVPCTSEAVLQDYLPAGLEPMSIDELNLPVAELERLKRLAGKAGTDDDVRKLLASNTARVSMLDAALESLVRDILRKRPQKTISLVVTSDHGIIRSSNSNILSNDSLSQEVLHVPMMSCRLGGKETPAAADSGIIADPVSTLKVFDLVKGIIGRGEAKGPIPNGTAPANLRPIIAEHDLRPILAYRKENFKLIHCLSNPYFQIATTNLFDLGNDPIEAVNIVGRNTDFTQQLLNPALAFCRGSPFYPSPRLGLEEETRDILKSLNYVAP